MPRPIIENSQHEYDPNEDLGYCSQCGEFYWRELGHDCPGETQMRFRPIRNAILLSLLVFLPLMAAGVLLTNSRASVKPAHVAQAMAACKPQHVEHCRRVLIRTLEALEWQKHETQHVLEQTRGKQPFAYAAKLGYLACLSFTPLTQQARCRPPSEMLGVGRCESGLQAADPTSDALGWTQWLTGTWNAHPAGDLGFSRLDVLAMGIATEALVYQDGGWHEWTCGWAAS